MSCGPFPHSPFPSTLVLSRPWWWRIADSLSRALAVLHQAVVHGWHELEQRRRARQVRTAVAHMSEHMLKDIGADRLLLERAAQRRHSELRRAIELQRGGGY